jgi:trigger factor
MVVEFDTERLEKAKVNAAQKISKKLNIPGFRKGKAPYRVIAKWVGEEAIVDEAMELISNDLYPRALDEAKLDPYGPGSMEKYEVEPTPTLIFTVPLAPSVDLKNYRDIRLPFEAITVTDEEVDTYLKQLRQQFALVEPSSKPAAMGNQVTIDIHSHFIAADESGEHTHPENEDPHEHADDADAFVHEHAMPFILDTDDDMMPGFSEKLVGVEPGQNLDFILTFPADHADYPERRVHFILAIQQVDVVTLPALNDDFAARVTEKEETPLTLLELRVRVRENLERSAAQNKENAYAEQVLEAILEDAEVQYPEALINDEVEGMLRRLDQRLRESKLTLRDYMTIYRKSPQELVAEYRPIAERNVRRALVMRQIGIAEGLSINDEELTNELSAMLGVVSPEQVNNALALLQQPAMQEQVRESMMQKRITDRIVAIARGEAPELDAPVRNAEPDSSEAS